MGIKLLRTFISSVLVCNFEYVASQDYYESVTVSTESYNDKPRIIIVGMQGNENLDRVVETKRLRDAKKLLQLMRHTQHMRTQEPFLKNIPKKFEIFGTNPLAQFNQYITDIHQLAAKENVTVEYKIKVEVNQIQNKGKKLAAAKKSKSKKYNVPLKKKNMRLSHFEILMRKLAETNGQQYINYSVKTTQDAGLRELSTTTKIPIKKYKPIISKVRPNYAKKSVKPVKKLEITLKSN